MNKQTLIDAIEAKLDPDYTGIDYRDGFNDALESAIGIITQHLDGYVILPEEMTDDMALAIGDERVRILMSNESYTSMAKVKLEYKAMIKASQESSDNE